MNNRVRKNNKIKNYRFSLGCRAIYSGVLIAKELMLQFFINPHLQFQLRESKRTNAMHVTSVCASMCISNSVKLN